MVLSTAHDVQSTATKWIVQVGVDVRMPHNSPVHSVRGVCGDHVYDIIMSCDEFRDRLIHEGKSVDTLQRANYNSGMSVSLLPLLLPHR